MAGAEQAEVHARVPAGSGWAGVEGGADDEAGRGGPGDAEEPSCAKMSSVRIGLDFRGERCHAAFR